MPRLIAFDLGGHAVKATVFSGTARRYVLEERVAQRVPQDGSAAPTLAQRVAALSAMISERDRWKSGAVTYAVAWPGDQATLHRMSLPFADRAQVERTLPFAVEAEVPFDLDEMVLAWRVLQVVKPGEEGAGSAGATQVLVVLVRHEALRGLVTGLSEEGVDPRYVFVDSDLLGLWAPRERVVAVIDIGHTSTKVSVVRDGLVHVTRSINVAGRDFTLAISRATNLSFIESEAMKHGEDPQAIGGEPQNTSPAVAWASLPSAAREALDAPIGLLLAEVRSTLIAAEDTLGVEIEEVRLCGGGARMHPIADYLRDDLRVPVEIVDGGAVGPAGDPVPPEFAIADALAARLANQTRGLEVDLRVGDLAYRGGVDVIRAVLLYGAPLYAFALIAFVIVSAWQYHGLSSQQAKIEQKVKDTVVHAAPDVDPDVVRDGTTAKAVITEKLEAARKRVAVLDRGSSVPPTIDALYELTKAFPPPDQVKVDVNELTITPENISFTAETDGYTSSSAVEEALQSVPRFSQAAKGNEKKVRDKVSFTMTVPLGVAAPKPGEEG